MNYLYEEIEKLKNYIPTRKPIFDEVFDTFRDDEHIQVDVMPQWKNCPVVITAWEITTDEFHDIVLKKIRSRFKSIWHTMDTVLNFKILYHSIIQDVPVVAQLIRPASCRFEETPSTEYKLICDKD
jgi:hypothetical protein